MSTSVYVVISIAYTIQSMINLGRCCCLCDKVQKTYDDAEDVANLQVRSPLKANTGLLSVPLFRADMEKLISEWKNTEHFSIFHSIDVPQNLVEDIIKDVEFIADANYLLHNFGVWDDTLADEILAHAFENTPEGKLILSAAIRRSSPDILPFPPFNQLRRLVIYIDSSLNHQISLILCILTGRHNN